MHRFAALRPLPLALLLAIALAGCRRVPVSQRPQFLMLPESREIALGASAYEEVLAKEPRSQNQQYIDIVNRVGQRIAKATEVQHYQWEFTVVASEAQNAFCLPGGKVVIYEGILPVCQNEAGLAVVMSHEIAHAVARHGGERMSQGFIVDGAQRAVGWAMSDASAATRDRANQAFGTAANYGVVLPYSRKHESEADSMGLVFMAKAGYDPREAPRFWQRFAAASAGAGKPPEFLSTHPSDDRRAKDLEAQMEKALALYKAAPVKLGMGDPILSPGRETVAAGTNQARVGAP
jgi:predicted Zn-dependent protease